MVSQFSFSCLPLTINHHLYLYCEYHQKTMSVELLSECKRKLTNALSNGASTKPSGRMPSSRKPRTAFAMPERTCGKTQRGNRHHTQNPRTQQESPGKHGRRVIFLALTASLQTRILINKVQSLQMERSRRDMWCMTLF